LESDPLSALTRVWLAMMLLLGRRYDPAIEQAQAALEIDPALYWAYLAIGGCYREKRIFDKSIDAHRKAVELSNGSPLMIGWLGLALAQNGEHVEARALLDRLHGMMGHAYVPPTSFAWIHLGLGDADGLFEWCHRAIDARDDMMMAIKSYAFFDPIRDDPRYVALLRRMNLEP
jgi:serine/threonine-protein kinase